MRTATGAAAALLLAACAITGSPEGPPSDVPVTAVPARAMSGDVEGMARDWVTTEAEDIARGIAAEVEARGIGSSLGADIDPSEAAMQYQANLSVSVGDWADPGRVPVTVSSAGRWSGWWGEMVIEVKVPATLSMDPSLGRASGHLDFPASEMCFGPRIGDSWVITCETGRPKNQSSPIGGTR